MSPSVRGCVFDSEVGWEFKGLLRLPLHILLFVGGAGASGASGLAEGICFGDALEAHWREV